MLCFYLLNHIAIIKSLKFIKLQLVFLYSALYQILSFCGTTGCGPSLISGSVVCRVLHTPFSGSAKPCTSQCEDNNSTKLEGFS